MKTLAPLQSKGIMANVQLAMKTIPLTRGYEAIVDDEDYERLSRWKWHVSLWKKPYARRAVWHPEDKSAKGIMMHREVLGLQKGEFADHINGDTLDNRRSNLRKCTIAENNRNRKSVTGSTSRFVGVSWDKRKSRWVATINGRRIRRFRKEEEAARAYDTAAFMCYGRFAHLNFPLRSPTHP